MKNLALITFGLILFCSCKKTYTCDCNATLPDEQRINYKHTIKNSSKKNAETECYNIEYNEEQEVQRNGGSYICDLRK
ncbi:MAG: hypothetical protein HYU67_04020 [Flavobacteriia bacterium]|nr:hypothetical protein [Flavobacteriia bacterium]